MRVEDAKPFLRWVGGKAGLIPEIEKWLPPTWNRYFEPFVGGGALLFHLQPKVAYVADANRRLISTYIGVRDHVENVIGLLEQMKDRHTKDFYKWVREQPVDHFAAVGIAAWFIYLNKMAFNGLFRTNKSGGFNVPMDPGRKPEAICDAKTLRAASLALQGVHIWNTDFRVTLDHVAAGDLAYIDPPYVPLSATSNFTGYTADGFDHLDQEELRDYALEAKRRGAHVILSNSSAEAVRALYEKDFEIREVSRKGTVSSKGDGRGAVKEFLIR